MPITRTTSLIVFVCLFVAALWVGPLLRQELMSSIDDLDDYRTLRASMSIFLLTSALAVFLVASFRQIKAPGQDGLINGLIRWLIVGLGSGLIFGLADALTSDYIYSLFDEFVFGFVFGPLSALFLGLIHGLILELTGPTPAAESRPAGSPAPA